MESPARPPADGRPRMLPAVSYGVFSVALLAAAVVGTAGAHETLGWMTRVACAAIALGCGIAALRAFRGHPASLARGLPGVLVLGTLAAAMLLGEAERIRSGRPIEWNRSLRIVPILLLLVLAGAAFERRARRKRSGTV